MADDKIHRLPDFYPGNWRELEAREVRATLEAHDCGYLVPDRAVAAAARLLVRSDLGDLTVHSAEGYHQLAAEAKLRPAALFQRLCSRL